MSDFGSSVWDEVELQEEVKEALKENLRHNQISQAYLFTGPEGSGKKKVAKALAAALNCPLGGCGACDICLRIKKDLYPDLNFISPVGSFITIDQVREMMHEAVLSPLEGKIKMVFIEEAETMNDSAANSMLKILEEPPENFIFILSSSKPEMLLSTVASRCYPVRFKTTDYASLEKFLKVKMGVNEPDKARLITGLSHGIIGKAIRYASDERKLELRKKVFSELQRIKELELDGVVKIKREIIKEIGDACLELKEKQRFENDSINQYQMDSRQSSFIKNVYSGRHKREQKKCELQTALEILEIMKTWHRDFLVFKTTGETDLIINFDHTSEIAAFVKDKENSYFERMIGLIEKTKKAVLANVGLNLCFEAMLVQMKEVV